jgi:hypothetical protein
MPTEKHLFERIDDARRYWVEWEREGLWAEFSDRMIDTLTKVLGQEHSRYFAIDGGEWPLDNPAPIRRIELAAAFDRGCSTDQILRFGSYISAQANYPWRHFQWLGDGHTIPCDSVPPALGGTTFDAVVLSARPSGAPRIDFPRFRGDPVNLLWMMPITQDEREYAMSHSSLELVELMTQADLGHVHQARTAVV